MTSGKKENKVENVALSLRATRHGENLLVLFEDEKDQEEEEEEQRQQQQASKSHLFPKLVHDGANDLLLNMPRFIHGA